MQKDELMLKVENVSKVYRLGEIGGTTLRDELQRLGAKIRHKEDPTKKIGAKNYNKGEKFKALDNISFEVKKGERIGIIGHNGAGKSTLLKLISRVTGPTDGKIYLNGRVASMLEVGTGFHPELTGRENVYMNGAILGMTKKEIDAKMEDIIEFSEVRQFIDTPVKRYSSGMYVKLAFSVAAHLDSEIMIMDEVLAVGDMAFQNKCLSKMKEVSIQNDRTILYVSHNMNTIRQLCDRVIVLKEGKIVFDGETEEGIKKYLQSGIERKSYFDVSKQHRYKSNTSFIKTNCIVFSSGNNSFSYDDVIELKIFFNVVKSLQKTKIRFVIKTTFNTPVSSTIIDLPLLEENKNYNLSLEIKKCFLSPGDYFMNFEFIQFDEAFNTIYHDQILDSVFFEIKPNPNLIWHSQYWSNVSFIPLSTKIEELKNEKK